MAKIRSMWKTIKYVMYQIQTEEGVYSANRVMPIWILLIFTLMFILTTGYIFIYKVTISQYNDLCMVYLGVLISCGAWLQGHHLTNSIYNTPPGSNGKPNSIVNMVNNIATKVQEKVEQGK